MQDNSINSTENQNEPIWDREDLLKRLANNEKLIGKLLTMYLADNNARLIQLRSAFEAASGDSELANMAHTLKGVSANLSATALNQCCVELELAVKAKESDSIQTLLLAVEDAHRELTVVFTSYLENQNTL